MISKKRKQWWIFYALLSTGLLLMACAQVAPAEQIELNLSTPTPIPTVANIDDTLRILFWQAPTTLNPHLATGQKDWTASRITYDPLATYDQDGNLIPILAAEIPSLENGDLAEDGKSVTWRLKQNIKWSDGEPFTAKDIKFTYDFIANPDTEATTAATYAAVESIEILDEFTVRINFADPNPAWSLPFVGSNGMIIPQHIFEPYNGGQAREAPANLIPVGTGPYQVVSFKPQEVLFLGSELIETIKIVFEPNPHHPNVDDLFFRRIELKGGGTVSEAARLSLQSGDVDFALNLQVDADTLTELEINGQGRAIANFGARVERILLNRTDPNQTTVAGEQSSLEFPHPFLSDERVRRAFSLAIDREAIAELYGPAGRATSNILVSPINSPNTTFEFDPEQAADLLTEAGWVDGDNNGVREKDGLEMQVVFQTSLNPIRQKTQAIVRESLRTIGVDVELRVIDSSEFFSGDPNSRNTLERFRADLQAFSGRNRSPDPGPYMRDWTCDEITQMSNNWSGRNVERWCNETYEALYDQVNREFDLEKRRDLFIQMNDLLIEDVVVIPLVHRAAVSGVNNAIAGLDLTPWDSEFWNIKDWRRASP